MNIISRSVQTLCLLQRGDQILLGMKKRGFGMGRWNGFGGKVQEGESLRAAALRELQEEAGILAGVYEEIGILEFSFEGKSGVIEVHVFRVDDFSGEPCEGEEMRPQWFPVNAIPFAEMWPDDIHWMSLFLAGKSFIGKFHFGAGDSILSMELNEQHPR